MPNKKGRLSEIPNVETQKKNPNPRRCVDERKLASTFFFDAEASCEFGFQTCLRAMLKQAGLGGFFEKSAPTYASWTNSFLCSLDDSVEKRRIGFALGGRNYTVTYDELDTIFGITAQPTSTDWLRIKEPLVFLSSTTGGIQFKPGVSLYNRIWSHPCLRLAHKVIRQAFYGQIDMNKVTKDSLGFLWAMTSASDGIPDWKDIFLQTCHKYRTVLSKQKITVGGMITLIGLFKGARVPKEDPVDEVFTYTVKKMVTGDMWKSYMESFRTEKFHYYVYDDGRPRYIKFPLVDPAILPYPDSYEGWVLKEHARSRTGFEKSCFSSTHESEVEERSAPLEATTKAIQKGSPAGAGSLARVCAQLDRIEEQLAQDRKVWIQRFADLERRIEELQPPAPPLLPHHE